MKYFLFLISLLFSFNVNARQIHIAIVDSGLPSFETDAKICSKGVFDLTNTDVYDKMDHGSNILGIISDALNKEKVDYCIYILKIYDKDSKNTPFIRHLTAYLYLYYLNVDIINYSSVGNIKSEPEYILIKGLVDKKIKFVSAAGNLNQDLDKKCSAWPACISGVISVGNLNKDGSRHKTSNYGKIVSKWNIGTNICSNHICMTGSSQATAVETAKQAIKLYKDSLKENTNE